MQDTKTFPTIQSYLRQSSAQSLGMAESMPPNIAMAGNASQSLGIGGGMRQNVGRIGVTGQNMMNTGPIPCNTGLVSQNIAPGNMPQNLANTRGIPQNLGLMSQNLAHTGTSTGIMSQNFAGAGAMQQNMASTGTMSQNFASTGVMQQNMASTETMSQNFASTGAIPKTSRWKHQIPNSMPWVQDSSKHSMSATNTQGEGHRPVKDVPGIDRCKRSSRSPVKRSRSPVIDDSFEPEYKQLITEDKMAARLGELSISNDHSYTSKKYDHSAFLELEKRLQDEDSDEETKPVTHEVTVELTPELQTALKSRQEFLPNRIVKRASEPCTALVLWKPPESILPVSQETLSMWKDNQESDRKKQENTNSSMCENGSVVMETERNDPGSDTAAMATGSDTATMATADTATMATADIATMATVEEHVEPVIIENIQMEPPQRQPQRIAQNNAHNFPPRDLLIAASEIIDNNNDPGAIDIEEMNAGLNRLIPGRRLPTLRARRQFQNNIVRINQPSPDDDMEL